MLDRQCLPSSPPTRPWASTRSGRIFGGASNFDGLDIGYVWAATKFKGFMGFMRFMEFMEFKELNECKGLAAFFGTFEIEAPYV